MYLVGNGARKLPRKIFLRGTRQRARAALYIYVTVYVILQSVLREYPCFIKFTIDATFGTFRA